MSYHNYSSMKFCVQNTKQFCHLLCICIGMKAEIEDAQTLLKQCGYAPLYPREKRDAVILYGLIRGKELNSVNDMLFEEGEESLLD